MITTPVGLFLLRDIESDPFYTGRGDATAFFVNTDALNFYSLGIYLKSFMYLVILLGVLGVTCFSRELEWIEFFLNNGVNGVFLVKELESFLTDFCELSFLLKLLEFTKGDD